MTLRLRLVLALVALVAMGMATVGVVTYTLYARSQYQRLDDQVRALVPLVSGQLREQAGPAGGSPEGGPSGGNTSPEVGDRTPEGGHGGPHPPSPIVPPGTYAELRDGAGTVVSSIQLSSSSALPALPADLDAPGDAPGDAPAGDADGPPDRTGPDRGGCSTPAPSKGRAAGESTSDEPSATPPPRRSWPCHSTR